MRKINILLLLHSIYDSCCGNLVGLMRCCVIFKCCRLKCLDVVVRETVEIRATVHKLENSPLSSPKIPEISRS